MKIKRTAAIAFAVSLTLCVPIIALSTERAVGAGGGLFPYTDDAAIRSGALIYADMCASCHQADLSGEENWRTQTEQGLMPAPPHDESGHTWHHPDAQLFAITKYGMEALVGGSYRSAMPGFGDLLEDREILEVLAYIKSTWPEEIVAYHNGVNAQTE